MQYPFSEDELARLFETDRNSHLRRNESATLEFKQAFSTSIIDEYGRDFAAFANNKGGYMLFGIKDSPHEIVGLKNNRFTSIAPEAITESLNSVFSQAVFVDKYLHCIGNAEVGILYIYESDNKPVIAKKNHGSSIRDADIFYRYGARTERIRFPELRKILDTILTSEREAILKLLANSAKVGTKNVAILNTLNGIIQGNSDKTVVLSENLVKQLKFIREGSFNERSGDPTLRLVGNLVPATVIKQGARISHVDPYTETATWVAAKVQDGIGKPFRTQPEHLWAWKYYNVRPAPRSANPEDTKKEYCGYKPALKYYLYTKAWVDFLISELLDDNKYASFLQSKGVCD